MPEDEPSAVTAKGVNVTVSFDGRLVTINRQTATRKTEKQIPVSSITAVQWKEPSRFRPGHLEFVVPGDKDNETTFMRKSSTEFLALRDAVQAALG
jgi:hypothetical protein